MAKRKIKPNNKFTSILSSVYAVLQQTAGARNIESATLEIIHLLDQNTRRGWRRDCGDDSQVSTPGCPDSLTVHQVQSNGSDTSSRRAIPGSHQEHWRSCTEDSKLNVRQVRFDTDSGECRHLTQSPGLLTEDVFKQIFAKFFPIDSSSQLYFHYVFSSIDCQEAGSINFEVRFFFPPKSNSKILILIN